MAVGEPSRHWAASATISSRVSLTSRFRQLLWGSPAGLSDGRPLLGEYGRMRTIDLADRYGATTGSVLLTGVQALVRVLFDQIRAEFAR